METTGFNPEQSNKRDNVVAIMDYTPTDTLADSIVKKGDRFILVSDADSKRWVVRSSDGYQQSSVPSRYLARETDLFSLQWISLELGRDEAEEILKNINLEPGAFIIFPRKNCSISYQLEILVKAKASDTPTGFTVSHYKIKREELVLRTNLRRGSSKNLTELVQSCAEQQRSSDQVLTFCVKKNKLVTPWKFESSVIEITRKLEKGSFGQVFEGIIFGTTEVALKTLHRKDSEEFMKEAEISRQCDHPNILQTIGICDSLQFIITEFMQNGSLKKYLSRTTLSAEECLSIAQKIASGMAYLDSMKLVHRDLAARNILVGDSIETIKIADFGLSRSLMENRYYITKNEAFPLRWTAPEGIVIYDFIILKQQGTITQAADVWSYGIVLWEIYSGGEEPYLEISANKLHHKLTVENWRLECPEKCPKATIYAKMLECWNIDRKMRPSFDEIQAYLFNISARV